MKWRKWNIIIHRDLGYLAFGLTIVYAISGVAVNHVNDWNPNYETEKTTMNIGAVAENSTEVTDILLKDVLQKMGTTAAVKSTFPLNPQTLQIFLEGSTVTLNVQTGDVSWEKITTRTGLHEMNFLHLNSPKKLWTYMADIYAVALAVLAVTGLFVLKGKKGIKGRGAWLTSIGIIIPLVFLWLYY